MLDLVRTAVDDCPVTLEREGGEVNSPEVSVESYPICIVEINQLALVGSPRLAGEDPVHTRVLAEIDHLPPIVVHRPTMQVIDGMHRVRAALSKGRTVISARMIDCDQATAFVLAVRANVTHGLPLSPLDRKAAAECIITTHPNWSDRAVAAATGLSDKTVSAIRWSSTSEIPHSDDRVGRDGRVRPLNSAARRQQAALLIAERPDAGLREIARATGLSPATVRDVRMRTERGEDPVPAKYRDPAPADPAPASRPASQVQMPARRGAMADIDGKALLAKLVNDPSLRHSENGRVTLRWLHHHTVDFDSCRGVEGSIPDHWSTLIAELARSCAMAWLMLADDLEKRH